MKTYRPDDLGTKVYTALNGRGKSPNTEPSSFGDALGWFLKAAGGNVSAAARLAGVPRRSMRDWVSGVSRPKPDRAAALAASAQASERAARMTVGRRDRLAQADAMTVQVIGRYNYDPGTGNRQPVDVGLYMEPDALDQLADAFLNGASPDELREEFAGLITGSEFYAQTMAQPSTAAHGWSVDRVILS